MEHAITLDLKDPTPIYAQIVEQVALLIDSGAWTPGHHAPSVRALAIKLKVNPMTVQKSYQMLKADGYIVARRGQGVFVKGPKVRDCKRLFEREMAELMLRGRRMGLTSTDMKTIAATSADNT